MKIDLSDGISDELNTPIKLKWALRTFIFGIAVGALLYAGLFTKDAVVEMSERKQVSANLVESYSMTRGFINNAYGTYWNYCGVWITADHVHRETLGGVPENVVGDAVKQESFIDATFYGNDWTCENPEDFIEGQDVWMAGYSGGNEELAVRRGQVYLKRSSSGSDGYENPTWIIIFPKNGVNSILNEPVAGGMSGGIVVDAETNLPLGIIVTQNSEAEIQGFGSVHSSDVVSLKDAHNALISN